MENLKETNVSENELLEALQSIATGEISGNTKNYKDTVFIMKQIAIEAIEKATNNETK